MSIKYTILGTLIYLAMALWIAAFGCYVGRARKAGEGFFASGFVVMAAAFILRWAEVEHAPLQNLFEVFLTLGMCMYPLWLFCRNVLSARGDAANVLIGVIMLVPVGFVFSAEPQRLPPALQCWIFVPHVATYMVAYVILAMAAVQAGGQLIEQIASGEQGRPAAAAWEQATYRLINLGFPLLTLGLVLGAVWGKLAWGDYWNWDPKELWSLTTFLVYIVYLHWRSLYAQRHIVANAVLAIVGLVFVIVTLLWVNLSRVFSHGLHSYASGG